MALQIFVSVGLFSDALLFLSIIRIKRVRQDVFHFVSLFFIWLAIN